jgi:hypothetical protein
MTELHVPFDDEFSGVVVGERQAGEPVDDGAVVVGDGARGMGHGGRFDLGHEPAVDARGMVPVRGGTHAGGRPVRQLGDELLGGGFGHHDHGVAVDRRVTVEQAPEMLDVADTHGATLELVDIDDAGLEQATTERCVRGALRVVDDAVVEVGVHLGVRLEDDLAGERSFARLVQGQPGRLGTVDAEGCGVRDPGRDSSVVQHVRQPPPSSAPWTRGASGEFRPRPPGRSRGRSVGTARRLRRRVRRENAPVGARS